MPLVRRQVRPARRPACPCRMSFGRRPPGRWGPRPGLHRSALKPGTGSGVGAAAAEEQLSPAERSPGVGATVARGGWALINDPSPVQRLSAAAGGPARGRRGGFLGVEAVQQQHRAEAAGGARGWRVGRPMRDAPRQQWCTPAHDYSTSSTSTPRASVCPAGSGAPAAACRRGGISLCGPL